ncbi:CD3324 family protein [Clostridium sp. Marseille-P299]|uniref:CD3324 family protein n=1 Tax=Clostridium sp. Marseille-P299 TaxID=1805477 RepID=UPI00082FAB96|nr:CD3324 family protein [Clostridium sp. Marseille-P299]
MSYVKAADILPDEIIELIQSYVDGECIYIPRKAERKKAWGENTKSKEMIIIRNTEIFQAYMEGVSVQELSEKYYLSIKSIKGIISRIKKENS